MRIRHKPWARPELAACPFYVKDPEAMRQFWHYSFPRQLHLCLELGCGKGGFLAKTAAADPGTNYVGVDIKSEVLALAKRSIESVYEQQEKAPDNILITSFEAALIDRYFSPEDTVSRIYINFPNPWPKERHKKRRLTHTRQLRKYRAFMSDSSDIVFKTDDGPLFCDTLGYLETSGFKVVLASENYHSDFPDSLSPKTEHEQMFMEQGLQIFYIEAVKRDLTD